MSWETVSILIPLIVLLVTTFFSLRKEKRDRDFEYRPIPSAITVLSQNGKLNESAEYFILFNDSVMDIREEVEGHFLAVTNVAPFPMLNVVIEVEYEGDFETQKYQVLLIQKGQYFLVPVSGLNYENREIVTRLKNKEIKMTFRSLSGQKYEVSILPSGKTVVTAKNKLYPNEVIISTEDEANSKFKKL